MKKTMILKRERSDAEKLRRHLHGDKGAKFSKGKIPCIDGGGYNRDYYHNGDKRHIAFGILRLPHGYFPGTIINIIPTLTISSWEHNNFIYEDRTEPRRMLVSRPLHPIRGGVYSGVSQEFSRGALPGLSRTIKCDNSASVCVRDKRYMEKRFRIRKLTPTECLRAMDVPDKDIQTMKNAGISDAQLYKLAGNSIVVACLEGIFSQMFSTTPVSGDTLFG